MPYRNYKRGRRRRYNRSTAASTIGRAWRSKLKRRAGGLVSRTALSNRRNIRAMKKCIETKMISNVQCVSGNEFDGQFCQNLVVDNIGTDAISGLPFCADLLGGLVQGAGSNDRVGAWMHLKNITMHYAVTCDQRSPQAYMNLLLVHDSEPQAANDLTDLLQLESASPLPDNWTQLAFQNLDVTGKENRYKILWRKTHVLSAPSLVVNGTIPAITQAAVGDEMQPAHDGNYYVQSGSKEYPLAAYGAKTWKFQYKINYGTADAADRPQNQSIKLFAFQTAPEGFGIPRCRLDYHCRVRFQDA